jgi:hypothetical protein
LCNCPKPGHLSWHCLCSMIWGECFLYWWNCWLSLFKLSVHDHNLIQYKTSLNYHNICH